MHSKLWWLVSTAFWVIAFLVLLGMFSGGDRWQSIDVLYTFLFIASLLIATALNDFLLRPRLLNQRKYAWYLIAVSALVLAGALVNQVFFDHLVDYVLPGYYFISYYTYFDLLKFFGAFLALTTLLALSVEWFSLQETRSRLATEEKKRVDAEFKALSNQVNPHFLFNSLTVLYALALENKDQTPGAIVKLADILRYVIYQSNGREVALDGEQKLIRDFIDLQRYRVHPSTHIEFDYRSTSQVNLAPMLLLPLVENAFKHGVQNDIRNAYVKIDLTENNGIVRFQITNSVAPGASLNEGGSGLKNLRDRLSLIYPKHSLQIRESDHQFHVDLIIDTSATYL